MTHCFQPDCVSCGSKMELRFANVREWCINVHAPYLFNAVSTCTLNHQKKWWVGDGEAADEGCKCSFCTLRNVSVLKTLCCGKTYSINFVFHWLRFYWMWSSFQTTAGGADKSWNATCTFFDTGNLLPKDLRFEHGGAKLASCPGRHLTSLHPCQYPSAAQTSVALSLACMAKLWLLPRRDKLLIVILCREYFLNYP